LLEKINIDILDKIPLARLRKGTPKKARHQFGQGRGDIFDKLTKFDSRGLEVQSFLVWLQSKSQFGRH
jgi:hypothetical protein